MSDTKGLVPIDKNWFLSRKDQYLCREDFVDFQGMSGVDFNDLLSDESEVVLSAQKRLVEQSVILSEIRNLHFGYGFPFLVYTQQFGLFDIPSSHNTNVDDALLKFDMTDSLRRRHNALSQSVIPGHAEELCGVFNRPVTINNMGSGVGLDTINAVLRCNGTIGKVYNCDVSDTAIALGRRIVASLEASGRIERGKFIYAEDSLTGNTRKTDIVVMVGIICGLQDRYAKLLLRKAYKGLNPGGKLIVTSSNTNMKQTDPLASFLIQNIGSAEDPMSGWGLNYRTGSSLTELLKSVGFKHVEMHGDSDFPNMGDFNSDVLAGVDPLPSLVTGNEVKHPKLPPEDVLEKKRSYNLIAVASK